MTNFQWWTVSCPQSVVRQKSVEKGRPHSYPVTGWWARGVTVNPCYGVLEFKLTLGLEAVASVWHLQGLYTKSGRGGACNTVLGDIKYQSQKPQETVCEEKDDAFKGRAKTGRQDEHLTCHSTLALWPGCINFSESQVCPPTQWGPQCYLLGLA